MNRQWNFLLYGGFVLAVLAFLSYFIIFARFPLTRDFPWLNLLLLALALGMLSAGLWRAYRHGERYRGKVAGPILALLSVAITGLFLFYNFSFSRQLPPAKGAPQVGHKAPDFTLPDSHGNPLTLSRLWGAAESGASDGSKDRWVLLVFYRGYW